MLRFQTKINDIWNLIGVQSLFYICNEPKHSEHIMFYLPFFKGGFLPSTVTHYVIPDPKVVRDYLEIFEIPTIRGMIFTQTAVHSVSFFLTSLHKFRDLVLYFPCHLAEPCLKLHLFLSQGFYVKVICV